MKFLLSSCPVSLLLLSLVACQPKAQNVSEGKVVNGEKISESADQRLLHSTVRIEFYDPDKATEVCTGFLIGPTHIVTAAHCLLNKEKAVMSINWGVEGAESPHVFSELIKAYSPHPMWSFDKISVKYDIGVISLGVPLNTNHPSDFEFKPLNIMDIEAVQVGEKIRMAGYGRPSDNDFSMEELRQLDDVIAKIDLETRSFMIKPHEGKGLCHGDSGGPTVVERNGSLLALGVTHGEGLDLDGSSLEGAPCNDGAATLAAISMYQGWMKCTFASHGNPLPSLKDDASSAECAANPVAGK